MSIVIMEMSEMSDSKELYQSKPPVACVAFLYTVVALCVAFLTWLSVGRINIVIDGTARVVCHRESKSEVTYQVEMQDEFCLEIPISSSDIQWVENGLTVRCSLNALPTSEYGYVQGEVIEISDQMYINKEGQGYYIVKACLDSSVLTGSNGREVSLQEEMIGEALILAGTQRAFDYIQDWMK